jgi:hypothetical protein
MMSRQPVFVGGRSDATDYRHELLGRLGLHADATDQEVEAAHDELVDFLELAPQEMKSWAAARTTDVDELFALLSGPGQDLTPPPTQIQTTAPDRADDTHRASAVTTSPAPAQRWPWRTLLVWAMLPLLVAVVLGVYWAWKDAPVPVWWL